jgi:hypothetical protein
MTPIFESSADLSTYYLHPKDAHTNAHGHQAMAAALTALICGAALSVAPCRTGGRIDAAGTLPRQPEGTAN